MIRLAYLVSHPIQYQAPLLRMISDVPEIDLDVYFQTISSAKPFYDPGFGAMVEWDVPLLTGYRSQTLGGHLQTKLGHTSFGGDIFKKMNETRKSIIWIHGFANPYYVYVIERALRSGIQVFIRDDIHQEGNIRSNWKEKIKNCFLSSWSRRGVGFLAVGALNRDYYISMGVSAENIFILPYAVDGDFFQQRAMAARRDLKSEREGLGLDSEATIVLFASKFIERKRGVDLIDAFRFAHPRLEAAGIKPALVFAGSGEEEEALKAAASDLPVTFLGFQNQQQLARLFGLVDLFVLPSRREPWGLVVNEAMSAGLPVIVSDEVGCWPDIVVDGVNGFVFKAGDVSALADRLVEALGDPDYRVGLGHESQRIIDNWGFQQDVDGFLRAVAWSEQRCRNL